MTTRGKLRAILIGLVLGAFAGGMYRVQAQTAGGGVTYIPFSPSSTNTWSGAQTFSSPITVNGAGSSIKGGVTITAPTSGSALTVNAVTGAGGISINVNGNAATTIDYQNANTGASANTFFRALNSADNLSWGISSTGFTGPFYTGGPTGEQAFIGTSANVPISLAIGGTERVRFGGTTASTIAVTGVSGQLAIAPTQPVGLPSFTVATLPTCTTTLKGGLAYVTDATAPTYNATLTGSGTVVVPVFCNGTAWTSH